MADVHGTEVRTPLGVLGSRWSPVVDGAGRVDGATGWRLDWWVGADDRWHRAATDAGGVRQRLVGDSPVVETAVRVPGGDVVHRTWAVPGEPEVVVVEVDNATPLPVALAVVVEPTGPAGLGAVSLDGAVVSVDGRPALVLPRRPARAAAAADDGALWDDVSAGRAGPAADGQLLPAGGGRAALLLPVTHRTTVRIGVVGPGAPASATATAAAIAATVAAAPSAERVAAGWAAQSARAARVVVPDERLQAALDAHLRFVLLHAWRTTAAVGATSGGVPRRPLLALADALGGWGYGDEADEVLLGLVRMGDDPELDPDVVVALAAHVARTGRRELAKAAVDGVALAAQRAADGVRLARRRRPWRRAGRSDGDAAEHGAVGVLAAAAVVLAAGGEDRAAADARELLERTGDLFVAEGRGGVHAGDGADLEALVRRATGAQGWPGVDPVGATCTFLSRVRSRLVREPAPGAGGPVEVLTELPPAWLGAPVEVHDLPTTAGSLSWGVRWHGERPALLWELSAPEGWVGELRCPGLDPAWHTSQARGEALLAAPTRSA